MERCRGSVGASSAAAAAPHRRPPRRAPDRAPQKIVMIPALEELARKKRLVCLGAWLCAAVLSAQSVEGVFAQGAVGAVLDSWHGAAAEANEEKYFSYFTPDAVFLGTDGTEP